VGRNSSCANAWSLLYPVNSIFILLHISLYLTSTTAVYTWKRTLLSHTLINTSENRRVRDLSSRVLQPISYDKRSVVTVANPYITCMSACSSKENDVFTFTIHCTVIVERNDCSVCYLKHYWPCNVSAPTQYTSATFQLLQNQRPLELGPICTYTVRHFDMDMSYTRVLHIKVAYRVPHK
jgi:hypothetical protein